MFPGCCAKGTRVTEAVGWLGLWTLLLFIPSRWRRHMALSSPSIPERVPAVPLPCGRVLRVVPLYYSHSFKQQLPSVPPLQVRESTWNTAVVCAIKVEGTKNHMLTNPFDLGRVQATPLSCGCSKAGYFIVSFLDCGCFLCPKADESAYGSSVRSLLTAV